MMDGLISGAEVGLESLSAGTLGLNVTGANALGVPCDALFLVVRFVEFC